MQKLLTIVVPVYKVEPYINKCLDSCILHRQDAQGNRVIDEDLMSQLEVIIVNDGTPDRSAEMSREYTIRYPQTFRQIDKENGGHGSAWNVGLREATGKYLRFLDSDDWLTNLDKLMQSLSHTDADLVFTHLNRVLIAENMEELWKLAPCSFNVVEPIDKIQLQKTYNCFTAFWLCTYKTSLLKNYYPLFAEHISYDDVMLYIAPLIEAKTFLCLDICLYQYLIGREGQSVSATSYAKQVKNHVVACSHFLAFWRAHKVSDNGLQSVIDDVVAKYCVWVWGMVTAQSYDAMRLLADLWRICPHELPLFQNAKQVRIYRLLPLPLYYCYYQIAKLVNRSVLYRRYIKHK